MQANETHISLETAKLLKGCGVESKGVFVETLVNEWYFVRKSTDIIVNKYGYELVVLPAYTWGEIEENAELFFGDDDVYTENAKANIAQYYRCKACYVRPHDILDYRLQKKYDDADLYFREHCVLIKK